VLVRRGASGVARVGVGRFGDDRSRVGLPIAASKVDRAHEREHKPKGNELALSAEPVFPGGRPLAKADLHGTLGHRLLRSFDLRQGACRQAVQRLGRSIG
jgi:hypothetical protein